PPGGGPPPGGDAARRRALADAWGRRPGALGWIAAVNHKAVGKRFIVTAFVFLLVGGIEALLIRTQLARPESDVLGPEAFNQTFTMHGTTMLFLFAVPILEGFGMYFAPLMVGTRDMPFPRLNAFGYWAYLFGGLFVYASIFAGEVPDGGWFAYVPLTGPAFSPGEALDFWLLGVTFVEVSGVVGAIELIVLFVKHRAPGMTLSRIPLFVWSVVVMAGAMLLAFPVLIGGSTLLELERSFDLPFYDPGRGGDPVLWQHLFWIFGHPEVYIILLPATGIVSTVVAAAARRPIVAYPLVVLALIAIGFVSFGLWVHHMFATGIPRLASAFFTAASLLIAIPSGIQIFAWIGTLWTGRVRWTSPLLFVIGFVLIFVIGGITGVMVAVVPFDLQVHDTYFVVAHFHYVLIGGAVFPIFAGLHHWWPVLTGRLLSEGIARATFWLMFLGFNIAFMPQHILGFLGMPRRVYTYREVDDWAGYNMASTVGGFVLALGILLFIVNVVRTWARPSEVGRDPWDAGTLEWQTGSPPPPYNYDRLPVVADLHPGWRPAEPGPELRLQEALRTPEGGERETWATSPVDGEVEELVLVAQPSLAPLVVALGLVGGLLGVLYEILALEIAGPAVAVVALVGWLWPSRAESHVEPVEHERPLAPPAPARRPGVTVAGLWGIRIGATAVTALAAGLAFANVYLAANADAWPPGGAARPGVLVPALAVAAAVLAAIVATVGWRLVAAARPAVLPGAVHALLAAAAAVLAIVAIARWPVAPTDHSYGAVAVVMLGLPALAAAVAAAMGVVVAVRGAVSDRAGRPEIFARIGAEWTLFTAALSLVLVGIAVGIPRFG
ncbi:MAG: cytochrome c oxidase subunit I, partial [Acidimicrobiia bacterium]